MSEETIMIRFKGKIPHSSAEESNKGRWGKRPVDNNSPKG